MTATRRQAQRSEAATQRVLDSALKLFSSQGYGATSMRQISDASGLSVGNLYHHFGSKEAIFQQLLDHYWELVLDPENRLQKVFDRANFPDDLEEMAAAIRANVREHSDYILLVYIDVIEFRGAHIHSFYEHMADRFREAYAESFDGRRLAGQLGEIDPLVGVMVATRWLYYFFTVESCFGVPMHFGMDATQAVDEFIRILRYGLLPRSAPGSAAATAGPEAGNTGP